MALRGDGRLGRVLRNRWLRDSRLRDHWGLLRRDGGLLGDWGRLLELLLLLRGRLGWLLEGRCGEASALVLHLPAGRLELCDERLHVVRPRASGVTEITSPVFLSLLHENTSVDAECRTREKCRIAGGKKRCVAGSMQCNAFA